MGPELHQSKDSIIPGNCWRVFSHGSLLPIRNGRFWGAVDDSISSLFLTLPWGVPRHHMVWKCLRSCDCTCLRLQLKYCFCQDAFLGCSKFGLVSFLGSSTFTHPPPPWELFLFILSILYRAGSFTGLPTLREGELVVGRAWVQLTSMSQPGPGLPDAADEWARNFPSLLEGRQPPGIHELNAFP